MPAAPSGTGCSDATDGAGANFLVNSVYPVYLSTWLDNNTIRIMAAALAVGGEVPLPTLCGTRFGVYGWRALTSLTTLSHWSSVMSPGLWAVRRTQDEFSRDTSRFGDSNRILVMAWIDFK